jgi:Ni/Fe-hydrogenase 1 B-type cytochrome subunit
MSASDANTIKTGTVHVYGGGIRAWHWINALCILVLAVTGFFIGSPPPSVPGEASDNFLFGYIRFAHFSAAYIVTIGFFARAYLAFIGDAHARTLFAPPVWNREFRDGALHQLRWYLFLEKEPRKWIGHNPLSSIAMFLMYSCAMVVMILTGGAMYSEGTGATSWQHALFGWVIGLFGGNSFTLHTIHHVGMWVIVLFVIIHVYAAFREEIMSRQTLISSMITGDRTFRDDRPD